MAMDRVVNVAEAIEGRKLGRFQIGVVAWLCILMVLEGFDMQAMTFAAPAIIKQWGVTRAVFGPVLSASLFGYLVGALALSPMADKFGRKGVIIAGAVLFGVFTLATVTAQSLNALLALRFLAGIGLGASIPSAIALAAEYVPARSRGTTVALMYVGYTLGAATGGFIVAWTIPTFGWHSVFYIGGVMPLIVAALLAFKLPESVRFMVVHAKPAARIAAILVRLRPDGHYAGATRFVIEEEVRTKSPVAGLFAGNWAFVTAMLWVAFIASFLGHHFLTGWLPTILSDAGLSVSQGVVAGSLFQLGGTAGGLILGYLLDKKGLIVVALAFLLAAPMVALIGVVSTHAAIVLPVVFLAGMGVNGGQIALNATIGMVYPTAIRSTGAGWGLGLGRVGSIGGPIIGGLLLSAGMGRPMLFLLAALPLACVSVAILFLMQVMRQGGIALRPRTSHG